jgi:hypothetical protein
VGGNYEDKPPGVIPYLRSVNHFHNPLTDQGFSGIWGTGFLSGESSIQYNGLKSQLEPRILEDITRGLMRGIIFIKPLYQQTKQQEIIIMLRLSGESDNSCI